MSLGKQKDMGKSAAIGICWTTLILVFAVLVGVIGRMYLGFDEYISKNSLVFISMVRQIFPAVISGVLLSAVLAASMSTADSQLLAAASSFASDVYKPLLRNDKASDKEMLWAGRFIVLAISLTALYLAANPNAGSIMDLVANAWGVFGAAFGPAILLSLFWRRFTFHGAVAAIIVGAGVDIAWFSFFSASGIYEILPGFFTSLLAGVIVSLMDDEPSAEVSTLYDKATNYEDL
jgi:sodium/proline symporter